MKKENLIIRLEQENEQREVENLVRECFWNVYQLGCMEHYVLHLIRKNEFFVPNLNFVLLLDNKIIGQVVFVVAKIVLDDKTVLPVLTFGPICISPQRQKKGYGKILLDFALGKAKELGYNCVLLEGDINFYSKCGFDYARNFNIRYHGLESGVDDSFFLCKELQKGCLSNLSGEYFTPEVYYVDPKEVDEFDKNFEYKEKKKLKSQIF